MRHHPQHPGVFALRQCLGWLNLRRNISGVFLREQDGVCLCQPPLAEAGSLPGPTSET